jgi:CRP-like cAMP-binding protein
MSHPTHEGPAARLGGLALLTQCTPAQLRRIDHLTTEVRVPRGRVLCRQHEIARECFIVADGTARVHIDGRPLTSVGRGEIVGELALLVPSGRRTATVIAATDMALLALTRAEFAAVMSACPRIAHKIVREATRRMIENATTLPGQLSHSSLSDSSPSDRAATTNSPTPSQVPAAKARRRVAEVPFGGEAERDSEPACGDTR